MFKTISQKITDVWIERVKKRHFNPLTISMACIDSQILGLHEKLYDSKIIYVKNEHKKSGAF